LIPGRHGNSGDFLYGSATFLLYIETAMDVKRENGKSCEVFDGGHFKEKGKL